MLFQAAPNPAFDLPQGDEDKLSDYIPMSNEVSRAPSKQVSVKGSDNDDQLEHEEEEEEDDEDALEDHDEAEYDGDGDVEMASTPAKKKALEKAAQKKAASGSRRAVKQDREEGVSYCDLC